MIKLLTGLAFLFLIGCSNEAPRLQATLGESDQALKDRVVLFSAYTQNNTPIEKRADIYFFDKSQIKVNSNPETKTVSNPDDFFKDSGIHILERTTTGALVIVYPKDPLYRSSLSLLQEWILIDGNWKIKDIITNLPENWFNIVNNIK